MLVTPGVLPAIIRGGKRPYSEGIASDHRTLYLDLDADTLFGKKMGEMDITKARNLDTKCPKRVAKNLEEVHNKFERIKLYKAMDALKTKPYTDKLWTKKNGEKIQCTR